MNTKIVRIFNTYGPRMRLHDGRAVPAFMSQALRNEDVTVFGDGTQTRSFTYISDLVDGIIRLMLSDQNDPINIGNPTRDDDRGDRPNHHQDDGLDEQDRLPSAADRRPQDPATRHHARPDTSRLGAEGTARGGPRQDDRILSEEGVGRSVGRGGRTVRRLGPGPGRRPLPYRADSAVVTSESISLRATADDLVHGVVERRFVRLRRVRKCR